MESWPVVLCDTEIPTKLKVLLYKTAIKPTSMYGYHQLYLHVHNWQINILTLSWRYEIRTIWFGEVKTFIDWLYHFYGQGECKYTVAKLRYKLTNWWLKEINSASGCNLTIDKLQFKSCAVDCIWSLFPYFCNHHYPQCNLFHLFVNRIQKTSWQML